MQPAAGGYSPGPKEKARNLDSQQWKAKFDAIIMKEDGITPRYGEISRAAKLAPRVAFETMRRRFVTLQSAELKPGATPALGSLEKDLKEWLRVYCTLGVVIYQKTVREKAVELAKAAGIEWGFKASKSWLNGFLARNSMKLREGQLMEAVRKHAVSTEALKRYFDNLEIASEGVKPENKYMLDEVHVNLLDCGGYMVRDKPVFIFS